MSCPTDRIAGKTIVITGASSGIGRSTAFEFARVASSSKSGKSIRLILTARRLDVLKEVAAELTAAFGEAVVQVLPVVLDVGQSDAVRAFVPSLPEEWRDIDVLVNNACVLLFPIARIDTFSSPADSSSAVDWPRASPEPRQSPKRT